MTILTSYDSYILQATLTVANILEIVVIKITAMMGGSQLQLFTSIKCIWLFESHSFLLKLDGKVDTAIPLS